MPLIQTYPGSGQNICSRGKSTAPKLNFHKCLAFRGQEEEKPGMETEIKSEGRTHYLGNR